MILVTQVTALRVTDQPKQRTPPPLTPCQHKNVKSVSHEQRKQLTLTVLRYCQTADKPFVNKEVLSLVIEVLRGEKRVPRPWLRATWATSGRTDSRVQQMKILL